MNKLRSAIVGLIIFAGCLAGEPAWANSCSAKAQTFVRGNPNLTLLAVETRAAANGQVTCIARVRIAGKNGQPPRVVVRRFNP